MSIDSLHAPKKPQPRIWVAAMVASILEWYDYALYGQLAILLSALFFPPGDPHLQLLAAYGVFAMGFFARPLGGILIGRIGDRYGRRRALTVSVLCMAIATGCTGLLPTYAQIGLLAPFLLILIRLAQGFALGGELAGASVYLVEHAPFQHRGLHGALVASGAFLGILLSAVAVEVARLLLGADALLAWGWRVLFVLGVVVGMAGLFIRHYCAGSADYKQARAEAALLPHPLYTLLHKHWAGLLAVIVMMMPASICFFGIGFYLVSFNTTVLGMPPAVAFQQTVANDLTLVGAVLLGGVLSDKMGRMRALGLFGLLLGVTVWPASFMATHPDSAGLGQLFLSLIAGLYIGPCVTRSVELFPPLVRYFGRSLGHNLATMMFGGTTPLLLLWLSGWHGDTFSIPAVISLSAFVALAALPVLDRRARRQNKA